MKSQEVQEDQNKETLVFRMIHGETVHYVFSGQIVDATNISP